MTTPYTLLVSSEADNLLAKKPSPWMRMFQAGWIMVGAVVIVIVVDGSVMESTYERSVEERIAIAYACGVATGRGVHEDSLPPACKISHAVLHAFTSSPVFEARP